MSQDFTTRLQLQLREAALRDERRSPFGRTFADLRHGMPAPAAVAAVALAAVLLAIVVAVGGLRWGGDETVSKPKVIATCRWRTTWGSWRRASAPSGSPTSGDR